VCSVQPQNTYLPSQVPRLLLSYRISFRIASCQYAMSKHSAVAQRNGMTETLKIILLEELPSFSYQKQLDIFCF
jgi:hypothetical protein